MSTKWNSNKNLDQQSSYLHFWWTYQYARTVVYLRLLKCNFNSFGYQPMFDLPMCTWYKCVLCCCLIECSVYVSLVQWAYRMFNSFLLVFCLFVYHLWGFTVTYHMPTWGISHLLSTSVLKDWSLSLFHMLINSDIWCIYANYSIFWMN